MIKEFIGIWEANKGSLRRHYQEKGMPSNYKEVVKNVVKMLEDNLTNEYDFGKPDSSKVHEIDDGHYQGMLVYLFPNKDYQPTTYWGVTVFYGSCSGCDTLQHILEDTNKEQQLNDIMTESLHVIQGIKLLFDEYDNDL